MEEKIMLPSSRRTSQPQIPSASAPAAMPMRRYAHPISVTYAPPTVLDQEGLQWIYATLYAQSVALEEIKALLKSGNNL